MISQVRRFNRTVTQRVGALDDEFLARNRPLGQARLLWEIGPDGTDIRSLRARLDLDSGYLSRLLRALEADGLVAVDSSGADGRVRTARLTTSGRAERAELDRRAAAAAESILEPLSASQRDRLVSAMAEVERLLLASAVEVAVRSPADPAARACVRAYFDELGRRFDRGFDPGQSLPAEDQEMIPPGGLFLVATLHSEAVGCGGLKFHAGAPAEVKRMWIAPAARGLGLGRRLLSELEAQRRRARGQRAAAGDQRQPGRGDQPVPDVRLPRGGRVQRRALRAPLVREDPGSPRRLTFWITRALDVFLYRNIMLFMARAATTADAFNAVAEPRRREILDLLASGERPVNDLVALLGLAQPLVSKHLRVLRQVGLVDVRGDGRQRVYRLNAAPLKPIYDWVRPYEQAWSQRFSQLDTVLEELKAEEDGENGRDE